MIGADRLAPIVEMLIYLSTRPIAEPNSLAMMNAATDTGVSP